MVQTKVTPVEVSVPAKFLVYRNAALNSSNAFTTVAFDTAVYDGSSMVNLTTGVVTITTPGFYWFAASCGNTAATTTSMSIALYKGSTQMLVGGTGDPSITTGSGNKFHVSGPIQCAAADTITARFLGGSGSVIEVGQAACWFAGFMTSST